MNINLTLCMLSIICFSVPTYGIGLNHPMLGCFSGSDKDTELKEKMVYYANNSEGRYRDTTGDAFEFIDLTELKVSTNDKNIYIDISLRHIPAVLIFNQANIPDNTLEYKWAVNFDIDADGTPANDISVSLSSFKDKGEKESIDEILGFETQNNVWLWSPKSTAKSIAKSDTVLVKKSTLSFTIEKSKHKALSKVTIKTPVHFSALYNFAGNVCKDVYPEAASE